MRSIRVVKTCKIVGPHPGSLVRVMRPSLVENDPERIAVGAVRCFPVEPCIEFALLFPDKLFVVRRKILRFVRIAGEIEKHVPREILEPGMDCLDVDHLSEPHRPLETPCPL